MSKTLFLIIVLSCTQLFSQVNLSSSLVACYALDGNASEPINNYAGTLSSVSPTTGHLGNPNTALYFSGQTSSYVELPNNSLLKPNQLSFSAWVNASSLNPNQMIVFTKNIYTSYHTAYALAIFDNGSGLKFVTSR